MNLIQFIVGKTWGTKDAVPEVVRESVVAEAAKVPGTEAHQEGFLRAQTVEEFDVWLEKLVDHCRRRGISLHQDPS
jgi:uncharacterized protein YllA (UPF0747 family)